MEWQPIETAPKDGTRIICLGPWMQPISSFVWFNDAWYGGPHNNQLEYPGTKTCPTNWVPLPKTVGASD